MYNLKKEYALSERYMKQAGVYLAVPKWEYLGSNFYGNLGEVYKVQNKYKEAIENFQRGLVILKKYPDPDLEYKYYGSLAELSEATGDYANAYQYQTRYSSLRDSLLNSEKFKASAELDIKYQQAVKDKEISRLQAEQKIRQLESENKRQSSPVTCWKQNEKKMR
ncbi:MAG: tetratricopeptide repeat protein [Chitinophagaceae bacterium]|nr:tetratricopeptide repeat protein [Chitinophagaceae bacterium]